MGIMSVFMGNAQKEYMITLFGAFGFTSAPAVWASPRIAITSYNVNQIAKGGQGDTPHMLPPPLGERGGHLRIFYVNENMNKIRFSTERAMTLWIIDENENSGNTFSYQPFLLSKCQITHFIIPVFFRRSITIFLLSGSSLLSDIFYPDFFFVPHGSLYMTIKRKNFNPDHKAFFKECHLVQNVISKILSK